MANTKTIYLAGGCFWGVEELFRKLPCVLETETGYANGTGGQDATYERVCSGETGFRETVRVTYDADAISLDHLLWAFFRVVDPTLENRQGNDRGTQYQSGIYWPDGDEESRADVERIAAIERAALEREGKAFKVELKPLENFFAAEEYHQHYLVKNPLGYCHVSPFEMHEVLAHTFDENTYR